MDTATINHISLCSGYGGLDIGLKRAVPSLRTICMVEREAFAIVNLVKKMEHGHLDPCPIWTDVTTFPTEAFHGVVDILSGGYPCQCFSAAGKRKGKGDDRYLWDYIRGIYQAIRPTMLFFENVEGHISLGLSTVISDMEEDGYRATWGIFSAEEVGAPHRRKRVFILAYAESGNTGKQAEWQGREDTRGGGQAWPSRPGQPQHCWEPPRTIGATEAKQPLGRVSDGITDRLGNAELYQSCDNRTDELRLLGNGVVPATAELAFRTLYRRLI